MHARLDFLFWFRAIEHIDWAERSLSSWDMYCCLRCSVCNRFMQPGQLPHFGENQMDCVGWSGFCFYC